MRPQVSKWFYNLFVSAIGLFFIAAMTAAILMPDRKTGEWCWSWLSHYLGLIAFLVFWRLVYPRAATRSLLHAIGGALYRLRRIPDRLWVAGAAVTFFAISYYLSGALFQHLPVESDSMVQYAGARIFSYGAWSVQSHPLPQFFNTLFFFNHGTYYTVYPPGHMLLLAVGHLAENPAAINPLLGSLSLIATYYLTREIGGVKAARISLLLFLVSPFIIFLSAEFDNRSTGLLCTTLFTLFYIKSVKTKRPFYAVLSGAALGYLSMTRPQTALPYALPFALYGLRLLWQDWRSYSKIFSTMSVATLPFIGFFLFYNWQTNGAPFLTGYQKYWGENVIPGSGFTSLAFWRGAWIMQTGKMIAYVQLLDRQFFYWPIGSITAVVSLWLFKAKKPFCDLLIAAFLSICASLTLTPYVYIIFGPRYLYETSSIIIVLTAIFIARCPAILRTRANLHICLTQWRGIWALSLVTLTAIALATTIRDQANEYGHNYRIGRHDFVRLIDETVKKPALVIIHTNRVFEHGGNYYDAFVYLQPQADTNDIIYVRDLGAENKKIMDYYPDRYVYHTKSETDIRFIRGIVPASPARAGRGSSSGTR